MSWKSVFNGLESHCNDRLSIMDMFTEQPKVFLFVEISIYKTVSWIKRDIQQTIVRLIL